jgi:hypothetical protein
MRSTKAALVVVVAAACAAWAPPCAAQSEGPDGVYGRLRADGTLSIEAGAGVLLDGRGARPWFDATARARYLDTAGLFVAYGIGVGGARYDALTLGVDLRPLMLARFFSDLERGPQTVDLVLDSIGLEMGVAWLRPGETFRAGSGFALMLGTGVEFPLYWQRGNGLTLRLAVRWVHSTASDSQGPATGATAAMEPAASAEAALLTLDLVGRGMTRLGLAGGR